MTLKLSREAQTTVASLEALFSSRAKRPITLDRLISDWATFASEVDQGYSLSIYEYTNDLGTRDLIQEILESLPDGSKEPIAESVGPADARFKQATKPDKTARISKYIHPGEGWWWARVPKELAGALAADLAPHA